MTQHTPPIASDYLQLLCDRTEKEMGKSYGWKSAIAREYKSAIESATGKSITLKSANTIVDRALHINNGCGLQTFLTLAWAMGYKVKLVEREKYAIKSRLKHLDDRLLE